MADTLRDTQKIAEAWLDSDDPRVRDTQKVVEFFWTFDNPTYDTQKVTEAWLEAPTLATFETQKIVEVWYEGACPPRFACPVSLGVEIQRPGSIAGCVAPDPNIC